MLRLLLDECTDPAVVDAMLTEQPDCSVTSVHRWRGRRHRGASDQELLTAAMEEHLTLVTRDLDWQNRTVFLRPPD